MSEKQYRYERCSVCGEFGWVNSHRCAPQWEWCDDGHNSNEWSRDLVRARDAEDAAIAAAELWDQEDYYLVRGGKNVFWVRQLGSDKITKWRVTGESVPKYYADPAEDDED